MLSQKSPIPSPTLPYPPTPTTWPWHSPVLRHIKFAWPMGLSFHWWPTRPFSDSYAARDTSSRGYWLVHIVVPPIGLQTPLAPWLLSLAPLMRISFFLILFIRYFPHLHFQCYPKSAPYPPTHSHFLALAFPCTGAYKVCKSNGPLFPMMAD